MKTSAALEAKKEKSLNTLVRYEEGTMTRKEWIRLQKRKGATVEESTKNRVQFNRTKYNRMSSYKEQEEYERKCDEKVTCFYLYLPAPERGFYEITKYEFEYFNSL